MKTVLVWVTLAAALAAQPQPQPPPVPGRPALAPAAPAAQPEQPAQPAPPGAPRLRDSTIERYYQRAMKLLEERQWEKAVESFGEIARKGAARADASLYWKAYSHNKRGQREEALATIQELYKSYASSRWLNDAKALEVEVRQAAGQPISPESEADEDLKLIAINSLIHSDPERAVPLLEKIIQGNQPPKLKERALFVLNQSGTARAREVVIGVARGGSNPDLQMKALQYLGVMGGRESRQALADIYSAATDIAVKRAILHSFMASGERDRLIAIAREEKTPELRRDAIRLLGAMGASTELWQMYGAESSADVKQQILEAMFLAGNAEKLTEAARTEKDTKLRREAVRRLGVMGARRTGDALVSIYASESDTTVRREVLRGLHMQNNARALVEIARKETNPDLKREAVQALSHMKSKEATDFMLEILNK